MAQGIDAGTISRAAPGRHGATVYRPLLEHQRAGGLPLCRVRRHLVHLEGQV